MALSSELMRAHRALCSAFVDEGLYRQALGGGRADLGTVARYLDIPVLGRPVLSAFLDPHYYRALNPAVADAGLDPLLHFIEEGVAEGRAPHPLLDPRFIANEDAHVLGSPITIDALMEVLTYDLADPSAYMDLGHYAAELGGEAPQGGLLRHFLAYGLHADRRPNAFLSPRWYAEAYGDVPADAYEALRHFVILGDAEARRASPEFDGALYRARYTDVADAGEPPLRHFLTNGRKEGRQAAMDRAGPVPAAPGETIGYDAMRLRLAAVRQKQKDAVVPRPPTMLRAPNIARAFADLRFPPADAPAPVDPDPGVQRGWTPPRTACMALAAHAAGRWRGARRSRSSSATTARPIRRAALLAGVANLVVLRQARNVAASSSNCNAAFAQLPGRVRAAAEQRHAGAAGRGRRGWWSAVLDADAGLAAAGPKLIYPSGRLQEAGCFIRADGESGMVGLVRGTRLEGGFCHDRDVAYCSGAALMFRRPLAGPVLFDEAFLPAYCEDADLCLRLIAAGHRVRYLHEAVVVHHLSVSTNRQSVTTKLRRIQSNQQVLSERWGPLIRQMDRVRVLAFYLPQFHATAENDLWWGQGFTEWTNVTKAQPSYGGHYQPHLPTDLGFYDLRLAASLDQQGRLAARYGIDGFVVYYYNFGSRRVLGKPLETVLANPDIAFNWCLCWANENWTRHWDGGDREILLEQSYDAATLDSIIADVVAQAADPRYMRRDGRPMFLVYRPLLLPDTRAFADACRAAFVAAGFAGVHLVYVESMEAVDGGVRPEDLGFDACVEFPPHGRAVPMEDQAEIVKEDWAGYRYDYGETVTAFVRRDSVAVPALSRGVPELGQHAAATVARHQLRRHRPRGVPGLCRGEDRGSCGQFPAWATARMLFVNAWNEWAEGAHLEPDRGIRPPLAGGAARRGRRRSVAGDAMSAGSPALTGVRRGRR